MGKYELPKLNYGFKDLAPAISEEQLKIHYEKHHMAYVNAANALLEKLDKARKDNVEADFKGIAKELSWNVAGHLLHSLFWENMTPVSKFAKPSDKLLKMINENFGSFDRFKMEFTKAAATTEGSGWGALVEEPMTKKLLVLQIEKHNVNVIPGYKILMVLDVFEHAYYIDYKNDRAKFIENFWTVANWKEVEKRLL